MNISYILPFYKKADLFRMVLPLNECFRNGGAEVILVLDEPSEEAKVLDIVAHYKDIKFKVIVNDWDHPWRPPCIPYNVGIRHATADHVILADPESVIVIPKTDYFEQLVRDDFRLCYTGLTWLAHDFQIGDSPQLISHKVQVCEASSAPWWFTYGLLLAPRIALERIYGFDEERSTYGHDDTDLRIRLTRLGYRCVVDGRIRLFHAEHKQDFDRQQGAPGPGLHIALTWQQETWGKSFSRVAYDYQKQ